jgi:6-phosphofructokinase
MAELVGNVLVGQSGGPTSVINASLAGIVAEALNNESIEEIYGGLNGVLGILQEDIVDLASESQQQIRALRHTPGAALGTCRYKLKKQADFERVIEVFKAHNIRYFFYIGGNDSQDTADKISKLAQQQGYELRVIGVPKTIDNDLTGTDHCPGYGSVIKYLSTTIREMACDNEAMGQGDLVSIVEVMGRSAGWIAAGTALAKRRDHPHDPPHLILLPEVPSTRRRSWRTLSAS